MIQFDEHIFQINGWFNHQLECFDVIKKQYAPNKQVDGRFLLGKYTKLVPFVNRRDDSPLWAFRLGYCYDHQAGRPCSDSIRWVAEFGHDFVTARWILKKTDEA